MNEDSERLQRVIEALEEVERGNPETAEFLAAELGVVWKTRDTNLNLFQEAI